MELGKAWSKPVSLLNIENTTADSARACKSFPWGNIDLVNSDPVAHKIHLLREGVKVFKVDLGTRQWITKPLDESGLYRLECDAHDWERGWVYAVENPYYD